MVKEKHNFIRIPWIANLSKKGLNFNIKIKGELLDKNIPIISMIFPILHVLVLIMINTKYKAMSEKCTNEECHEVFIN